MIIGGRYGCRRIWKQLSNDAASPALQIECAASRKTGLSAIQFKTYVP
jgi:hypothetical protein